MKLYTALMQSNLRAVNNHPKCKDLVVAYKNRTSLSFTCVSYFVWIEEKESYWYDN